MLLEYVEALERRAQVGVRKGEEPPNSALLPMPLTEANADTQRSKILGDSEDIADGHRLYTQPSFVHGHLRLI